MIADEADSLFLDSCCVIQGEGPVVGLTATSIDAMYDYEERHVLRTLRFSFVSSGMSDRVREDQVNIVPSVDLFFQNTDGMARLIYCRDD